MIIIGVNFNGTLVDDREFSYLVPVRGAKEAMKQLKDEGYKLIVYSRVVCSENEKDKLATKISSTLNEFGIVYDDVYVGDRLVADFYIDDRALPFDGNWHNTLELLKIARFSKIKSA